MRRVNAFIDGKAEEMANAAANGRRYPEVYICSPYAGNVEKNVKAAIRYSQFVIDKGYMPVASHLLYPQILDDSDKFERELGLAFGICLLESCLEVWVFADTDDDISAGMKQEIEAAKERGMPVRYFKSDLTERGVNYDG